MEMKKTVGRCDVGGALHAITGYLQYLEQAVSFKHQLIHESIPRPVDPPRVPTLYCSNTGSHAD